MDAFCPPSKCHILQTLRYVEVILLCAAFSYLHHVEHCLPFHVEAWAVVRHTVIAQQRPVSSFDLNNTSLMKFDFGPPT